MTVERLHHALDSAPAGPHLEELAVPRPVAAGVADLVRELGENLESVVYYEHPFTRQDCLHTTASTASAAMSRIVAGEDVRPRIAGGEGAAAVARCVLFALRQRFVFPLSSCLQTEEVAESELSVLFERLVNMAKGFPVLTCLALGPPGSELAAPGELRRALPDVDFGILDEIAAIRRGDLPLGGAEGARTLLQRMLELDERINDRVLARGAEPGRELLA
jgi:hypothetical protein